MEKKQMVKEGKYKILPMSEKTRILNALAEEDYEYLSKRLKKFKITEDIFLEMCGVAIDNENQNSLRILLDLYSTYHTQHTFDRLEALIMNRKAYKYITFLSDYIDEINQSRN